MDKFVNPVFTADQFEPLSVDRKTPPDEPTKSSEPLNAKEVTVPPEGPFV